MANFTLCFMFYCLFLPPTFFQILGFISPFWVSTLMCNANGLFYKCCEGQDTFCSIYEDGEYLNRSALALEGIAACLTFLVTIFTYPKMCKDMDFSDKATVCCMCTASFLFLFPIAGLLSIIGCIIIAVDKASGSSVGWSYIMCLCAGIYTQITVVVMCLLIYSAKKHSKTYPIDSSSPSSVQVVTRIPALNRLT